MSAVSRPVAAGGGTAAPRLVDLLANQRPGERSTPYGSVWDVLSADGLEAVVVVKDGEEIDPGWFSSEVVDLIVLLRGRLRVEFERSAQPSLTMKPGQLLVIGPGVRCRAYRWPRSSPRPAVFLAVYPPAPATSPAPAAPPSSGEPRPARRPAAGSEAGLGDREALSLTAEDVEGRGGP
jgi:quercetin dioxygenase-like cupin family protein